MSLCISIKTELRVITRSRILVYRTPLNNKLEEYSSKEVKAIKEIVKDLDYSNCIVFVDGFQKDENYILKENEVATIRQYPSGSNGGQTAYILLGFATFGLTMLADVVIGACGGTRIYDLMTRNKKSAVNKTAQTSTTTENLPAISGAKNQSQENQTYPFVMGKHLYTPAYIGKPYRTISGQDGEEQTFHALYLIDYNSCEVTDFKLGITDIASNKEKQTSGNIVIDSQYYDAREFGIKLEIQESGEVSLYSQKVVEEQLSSELTCEMIDGEKKSLTAYCFSSKYPAKVELEFTYNGLIDFEQDGTEKNATVSVDIEASYDGGKTWGYFANIGTKNQKSGKVVFTSNGTTTTATGKKNSVMRFTAEKTLTLQELKKLHANGNDIIEFRVKKTSYNESERKSDDVYLTGIRTWVADYKATESRNEIVYQNPMNNVDRDKTTRLGFEIKANQLLDSQLETLNCIVSSKCKTWNGNEWSFEKNVTQNPGAIALELLQGNLRGDKYKYNDSQLDLESFGAFYEYCEQNNFKCNGVLVQQTKTQDVVNTILSCGRGFLTLSGNKYAVCIDKPREFPVMVLNNQNVLDATNEKSFDDIPDGFRVKFINETNGYTEEERDVLVNTNAENPYYEKLEIPYQTDPEQIYKFVWYQWLCRKLRPEVWNRKVSVDGNLIEIGSMVEVQDDTILVGIGDGAEIVQVIVNGDYITGIITDGQFSVEDNSERYGVKITQTSENYSPKVRTVEVELKNGAGNEFVFKNPISLNENIIPCIGDIVSFGIYDRITSSALCFAKKDNGDGTFDLTLIPYDDRVYTIPEEIPEFESKVTVPLQSPEMQPLQSNYVSFEDVKSAIETVSAPDNVTKLVAQAVNGGIDLRVEVGETGRNNTIKKVLYQIKKGASASYEDIEQNGVIDHYDFDQYFEKTDISGWTIRAKVENIAGLISEDWFETTLNTNGYGTWIPSTPINLSCNASESGLAIKWKSNSKNNFYGKENFVITIKYNENIILTESTDNVDFNYIFNRTTDKYPEKHSVYETLIDKSKATDLSLYSIEVKAVDLISENETKVITSSVNDSSYLTWQTVVPTLQVRANQRNISLLYESKSYHYGKTVYRVAICKQYQIDNEETVATDYFAPTETSPAVNIFGDNLNNILNTVVTDENEELYKGYVYHYGDYPIWKGNGNYQETESNTMGISVPLDQIVTVCRRTNENGENIKYFANVGLDTLYKFKVCAVVKDNLTTVSETDYCGVINGIATATSAYDTVMNAFNTASIVDGSIVAEKIYAKALSAISANMGKITDGSFEGNENNYWYLSDSENGHSAGDFQIGTVSGDYLRATKNKTTGKYQIEFKASNFEVKSGEIVFSDEITLYNNDTGKWSLKLKNDSLTTNSKYTNAYHFKSVNEITGDVRDGIIRTGNVQLPFYTNYSPEVSDLDGYLNSHRFKIGDRERYFNFDRNPTSGNFNAELNIGNTDVLFNNGSVDFSKTTVSGLPYKITATAGTNISTVGTPSVTTSTNGDTTTLTFNYLKGATGTTPTIKCANGSNINVVGTPSVTASTSGDTTTFTFNYLKGVKGDNGSWYGICSTSANTKEKKVTCPGFSLSNGIRVSVNFSNACSTDGKGLAQKGSTTFPFTSNVVNGGYYTLNVNGTGAKTIYVGGEPAGEGFFNANEVHEFVYDGTYWHDLTSEVIYSGYSSTYGYYIKYRNKELRQWGEKSSSVKEITYPVKYNTTTYNFNFMPNNPQIFTVYWHKLYAALSNTKATLYDGSPSGLRWNAIGY